MEPEVLANWKRFKEHGDGEARDQLVMQYLPLVKFLLGKLSIHLPPTLEYEDLNACGVVALLKAMNDFDLAKKVEFTTFAVPRIRGSMIDELRAHDWVPRGTRKKAAEIERTYVALADEMGHPPTVDEIGERMDVPPAQIDKLLSEIHLACFLSLDTISAAASRGRPSRVGNNVRDRRAETPIDILEQQEQVECLAQSIAELPEKERTVVLLYYQQDLMLREIAEVLHVSKSRISQIHSRAVFLLREKMKKMNEAPVGYASVAAGG